VTFKITKAKDLPPPQKRTKYPWDQLEVGDSFFVPCAPEKMPVLATSLTASGNRRVKDYRITTRREKDGIRVWRIA
jgi:hypothetical protein